MAVMLAMLLALTLQDIRWLAGDWQLTIGKQCVEEHWTAPSANMLVGTSRTVEDGRTISFEFLRIEARADAVYYVAQPGGRPPVDFRLASELGPELVFVNPGHNDHLKRIIYRRQGDDGVSARVEGADEGRAFAADYAYRRAPNDAAGRCGLSK
jgi:hypothetical protein